MRASSNMNSGYGKDTSRSPRMHNTSNDVSKRTNLGFRFASN